MRFRFLELPGEPVPRAAVPVVVAGIDDRPLLSLVDTGALRNVFAGWIAGEAGIPLDDAPTEQLAAGGLVTEAKIARADLAVGDVRFDAAIWFCDPWPFSFNLLGQEGFLRFFHLELCAAEGWLELTPEPHS